MDSRIHSELTEEHDGGATPRGFVADGLRSPICFDPQASMDFAENFMLGLGILGSTVLVGWVVRRFWRRPKSAK